jgi:hypothetical protein
MRLGRPASSPDVIQTIFSARTNGREMTVPPVRRILEAWSALLGVWGSSYLAFLDELSVELAQVSETMQWPFLIIGAVGTGSALVSSWQVSRQPEWRRAHGLAPRPCRR